MSNDTTTIKLPGTPKPWMNTAVMTLLRTPGLHSAMGKTFLILTVTGAKTGHRYTTPDQYVRDGDRLWCCHSAHDGGGGTCQNARKSRSCSAARQLEKSHISPPATRNGRRSPRHCDSISAPRSSTA